MLVDILQRIAWRDSLAFDMKSAVKIGYKFDGRDASAPLSEYRVGSYAAPAHHCLETHMNADLRASPESSGVSPVCQLLIFSDIRFVREGLAEVLQRDGAFRVAGVAVDIEQACRLARSCAPRIILVDAALQQGLSAVWQLRECACGSKIVAFALLETESEVIAWARAGICGYIPRNTPLSGLVEMLHDIDQGEQVCPTRVAAGMLRWIAQNGSNRGPPAHPGEPASLTAREYEVAHLIGKGLSNKEIARRLGIGVATTKSHVHSILAKLGVARRSLAVRRLHGFKAAVEAPPMG